MVSVLMVTSVKADRFYGCFEPVERQKFALGLSATMMGGGALAAASCIARLHPVPAAASMLVMLLGGFELLIVEGNSEQPLWITNGRFPKLAAQGHANYLKWHEEW